MIKHAFSQKSKSVPLNLIAPPEKLHSLSPMVARPLTRSRVNGWPLYNLRHLLPLFQQVQTKNFFAVPCICLSFSNPFLRFSGK
ncbi:hypothetical protein L1887_12137 [Cichorium endivia]|nr:hypothetical protein L1887_12137 [Cichorium endivia]